MKLNFRVSQTTNLESRIVIGLILLKLKDEKYRVTKVTNDAVAFDDYSWKITSNIKAFSRLGSGVFEIKPSDEGNVVELRYHIWIIAPLVIITIAVVVGIVDNVYGFSIIAFLLFSIQELVRIGVLKETSNTMLKEILSTNFMDQTDPV